MDKSDPNSTHFGFAEIPTGEKAGRVRGVFESVAGKYDIMNDVMSGGIHRLWKDAMMDWLAPRSGQHLLDVAGGTGDIAFRFLERAGGVAKVDVLDLTHDMLVEGRKRAAAASFEDQLAWLTGDAMALPYEDNSFDRYTISFGLRNVTDQQKALHEAYRVLRRGGRIMILEFSHLPVPLMQRAYDLYSFNVIPKMGEVIVGDRDSYQYLVESIRQFPKQEVLSAMLKEAGFGNVRYRNLTLGVAALHSGWKL